MTPKIRKGVAVFTPQGFIDANSAPQIISKVEINFLQKAKVRAVVVSLSKIVFFNKNGISIVSDILKKIKDDLEVEVGFCEYSKSLYSQFLRFFDGSPEVHLFQSLEIVDLFVSGQEVEGSVIVYNGNSDQRGLILMKLTERGVKNVEVAKEVDDFKQRQQNKDYKYVIDLTCLSSFSGKMPFYTKGNSVIYSVLGYIDGEIADTFNYDYHQNSLAVGFKAFIFNCEKVNSINTHGANFFTKLAVNSAEYGANICLVGLDLPKIPNTLLDTLRDGGIIFEDTIESALKNEDLNAEESGSVVKKDVKIISRRLVREVPVFVDATVETIEIMTGAKAEKSSATVGGLSIEKSENFICTSVGFFGDLDGIIFLFFQREIAKKACLLLLGEESKTIEEELDALSELINIITGRVKTELINKKKINISNTLPRTFSNIEKPIQVIGDKKGVFVKMLFDNEPFYFFLTR